MPLQKIKEKLDDLLLYTRLSKLKQFRLLEMIIYLLEKVSSYILNQYNSRNVLNAAPFIKDIEMII